MAEKHIIFSDYFNKLKNKIFNKIAIILALTFIVSMFPVESVRSYDEPFTGHECACSALDDLGWTGSSEGFVLGYPRYLLRCDYTKSSDNYTTALYGPATMTLQIQYFESASAAATRFAEYRQELKQEGRLIQAENTADRASVLEALSSFYRGNRYLYRDNWIILVGGGGIVFKSDEEFIQTCDALEKCAWAIINSKKTTTKTASVTGIVQDGHDHPLEKVHVELFWDFNDGKGWVSLGSTWTDEKGQYKLEEPKIQVPMPKNTEGYLRVELRDKDKIIEIIDGSVNPNTIVYCDFGDVPRTTPALQLFQINSEADLSRDLIFPVAPPLAVLPADMQYDPEHSDDCAVTYYYTYIAVKFYRDYLDVTFGPDGICNHTPVPIITWSNEPDVFTDARFTLVGDTLVLRDISISITRDIPVTPAGQAPLPPFSAWNLPDAPKNREFHEFSHYMMQDFFEGMQNRLTEFNDTESKDVNLNGTLDQDQNHEGYFVNHLSTTDAWEEGFAEFMACAIADWALANRYSYQFDDLAPYIYTVRRARSDLESRYADTRDEELSVACILWDLYDGIKTDELDEINIGIHELWSIIMDRESFVQYWEMNIWDLLRNWTGDRYALTTFDFPSQYRHIACIKDLYDALIMHLPEKKSEINQIFAWHDIWVLGELYVDMDLRDGETYNPDVDLWLPAFDLDENGRYTGPDEVPTETILLPPRFVPGVTQVHEDFENIQEFDNLIQPFEGIPLPAIEMSRQAVYHGEWGLNIEVDSSIKSSLKIDKPFHATGTNYLCFWAKVPAGVEFDVRLADNAGLWISPKLKGKANWDLYYINYGSFTNTSGTGGSVNQTDIKYIVIDFISTGTYSVNLDYITSETSISEVRDEIVIKGKPIVIMGIGSVGRAFRRNKPPPAGSFVEIKTDSVPAKIKVQIIYEPPYESHNFSYEIEITTKSEQVNVLAPGDGSISIVQINNKGEEVGTPLVITSEEFWDNVNSDNPGLLGQVELTGSGGSIPWLSWLLLAIAAVLFIFCLTLILKRR